jgi:hypothetical protein
MHPGWDLLLSAVYRGLYRPLSLELVGIIWSRLEA